MRIFVVDDQVLFREALVNMLKSEADITVVGEASTVREAVEKVLEVEPDLVLLDLILPDGDGLEAMKTILSRVPETRVILLSAYDSDDMIIAAFLHGARGYLLKNMPMSKLLICLRAVERGEVALSRAMTGRIIEELVQVYAVTNHSPSSLDSLTSRELDVLREIGTGASNQEIAERLFISENTVKIHVHNIYEKLKPRNRQELVSFAQRAGVAIARNGSSASKPKPESSFLSGL